MKCLEISVGSDLGQDNPGLDLFTEARHYWASMRVMILKVHTGETDQQLAMPLSGSMDSWIHKTGDLSKC